MQLNVTPAAATLIAAAAGVACKLYDNGVDVAGWSDGSWQLEISKLLVVLFMTLFLMMNWGATLLFATYTIICNWQRSADTTFWQVAGVIPAIAGCLLAAAGNLPDLADVGLAGAGAALVIAEAHIYPEEMSWNKWLGRALITCVAGGLAIYAIGHQTWPPIISLLAAWTAGYNALSVAWTRPRVPK
jgi:hypothetical protein